MFNVGYDFFFFNDIMYDGCVNISGVSLPGKITDGVNKCFQIKK